MFSRYKEFRCSSTTSHWFYSFCYRFQGLLFSTNECLNAPTDMIRIWLHECQRVYGDKLIDDKDIDSFNKMQTDIVKKSFEEIDESIVFDKPNIFCHFAGGIGEPKYMPIKDWGALTKLLAGLSASDCLLYEDLLFLNHFRGTKFVQ